MHLLPVAVAECSGVFEGESWVRIMLLMVVFNLELSQREINSSQCEAKSQIVSSFLRCLDCCHGNSAFQPPEYVCDHVLLDFLIYDEEKGNCVKPKTSVFFYFSYFFNVLIN